MRKMGKFIDNLSSFLGLSNQDEDLIKFFTENNFIKRNNDLQLCLYDEDGEWLDEHDLYIENHSKGLCFIFTDEAFFLENINKPLLGEVLYLSTIFFFNDGVDGYSKYNLGLPFSLEFSMKSDDLLKIFGNPIFYRKNEDGILVGQKWSFENVPYTLFVDYDVSGHIKHISLSIPATN